MPVFFNAETLNNEQLSRYDWCLYEYRRILLQNAEREKQKLKLLGKLTPRIASDLDNQAKIFQPSNKSALFWRLLQGKPALKEIPPTSFSYPWYQLIEGNKPLEVIINFKKVETHLFGISFLPKKKNSILINDAPWDIINLNSAASKLLDLDDNYTQSEIKSLLDNNPEFIVCYKEGDPYTISLSKKILYGWRKDVFPEKCSFNIGNSNPTELEIITSGEQMINEQSSKKFNFFKGTEQMQGYIELMSNMLGNPFDESSAQWDWLKIEIDNWFIKKLKT